jgi:hypothetical protein
MHPSDLGIAATVTLVLCGPTLYWIMRHWLSHWTRDFSWIPHQPRHLVASVFRFGIIVAAAEWSSYADDTSTSIYIWTGAIVLIVGSIAASTTARRLFINGSTGLVTWSHIGLPWLSRQRRATFIDDLRPVQFDGRYGALDLLGLTKLEKRITTQGLDSTSTTGHYSERSLERVRDRVNEYLEAFRKHDSGKSRELRAEYKAAFEAHRAPYRERVARREALQAEKKRGQEQRLEARKRAREQDREQRKKRKLDKKFQG